MAPTLLQVRILSFSMITIVRITIIYGCFKFSLTECCHDELFFVGEDEGNIAPQPGIWYVQHAEGASHMSMVPLWFSSPRQRKFWVNIGEWLKRIEK